MKCDRGDKLTGHVRAREHVYIIHNQNLWVGWRLGMIPGESDVYAKT